MAGRVGESSGFNGGTVSYHNAGNGNPDASSHYDVVGAVPRLVAPVLGGVPRLVAPTLGASDGEADFAAPFVRWCQDNRVLVEATAFVLQVVGGALTSSVFFATTGVPMVALGSILLLFLEGGQPAGAVKTQAKLAQEYAIVSNIAMGILALVSPFTGPGIAASPGFIGVSSVCGLLEGAFESLSKGRVPKSDVLLGLANVGGLPLSGALGGMKPALKEVDKMIGLGKKIPLLNAKIDDQLNKMNRKADALPPVLDVPTKVSASSTVRLGPGGVRLLSLPEIKGRLPTRFSGGRIRTAGAEAPTSGVSPAVMLGGAALLAFLWMRSRR